MNAQEMLDEFKLKIKQFVDDGKWFRCRWNYKSDSHNQFVANGYRELENGSIEITRPDMGHMATIGLLNIAVIEIIGEE